MLYESFDALKRVIDGVAYNTRTATALGETLINAPDDSSSGALTQRLQVLFVTRGNRYFLATWTASRDIDKASAAGPVNLTPFSRDQAQSWLAVHCPESAESLRMSLRVVEQPPSTGAAVSVRLSANLKESITLRAQVRGIPANDLYNAYLRHGFATDLTAPVPSADRYRTEDGPAGVRLLNDQGVPALDGIEGDGSSVDIIRGEYAAVFRQFGRTLPRQVRNYLISAIEGPSEEMIPDAEERKTCREQVLHDVVRWLRLTDALH
ncbi:hypothetical protein [Burkholderia sp. Ax-1719]|uniref:hypothetical protein n=1 Tax=Burkholderia sp. Ax-1719 TaxID=2608334 RepID=UPI001421CD55|nr:hypothetical protein [Burkholderia sp. Ax-1719]NIE63147.1 hypothetical protein [Burkholderia sp. Ax-1719]